jgi:AcrR family transcriptional regulator
MKSILRKARPRQYRQETRALTAEAHQRAVRDAAVHRLRTERRLAEVTLEDIARDAGVTVRTVLRQYGSKDKLLKAAFLEVGRQVEAARPNSPPGDVDAALKALLQQYEAEGDLNARVVSEEHEIPILHRLLQHARASHRRWLQTIFGPLLANRTPDEQEVCITALYAATEVQLWKVLRRDLRQSAEQTARIIRRLIDGVCGIRTTK